MSSKAKSILFLASIPLVVVLLIGFILLANNRPPHVPIPTPKMPVPNGWDDYVKAGELAKRIRHSGPLSDPVRKPNQWSTAELKSFVDDNAPAFAAFRKGLGKPCQQPPIRSMSALARGWGPYSGFRELARRLSGEALYYQRVGQFDRAFESRLDCIQFGAVMPKDGNLISLLVGAAMEAIGGKDMADLLQHLTPGELERSAARLRWIRVHRATFAGVVLEEGYSGAAMWQQMLASNGRWRATWNYAPSSAMPGTTGPLDQIRCLFANKTACVQSDLAFHKALAAEQRGPYTGKTKIVRPTNPIAQYGISADVFVRCRKVQVMAEARAALLETEVALRRYRYDKGTYPENLRELAPKYLKVVTDPFGRGKALKYKQLDAGRDFLLYSLGTDLTDDHGSPAEWNKTTTGDLMLHKPGLRVTERAID